MTAKVCKLVYQSIGLLFLQNTMKGETVKHVNKKTDEPTPPAHLPYRNSASDNHSSKLESNTITTYTASDSASSVSRGPEKTLLLAPRIHLSSPPLYALPTGKTTTTRDTKQFESRHTGRETISRGLQPTAQPPGAIHVGEVSFTVAPTDLENIPELKDHPIDHDDASNKSNNDDGTSPQLVVAAELSPDDDITGAERMERQIQEEVEARLLSHPRNQVVAEAVVVDSLIKSSHSEDVESIQVCGLSRRSRACVLLAMILLVVGIVTGVMLPSSDDPLPVSTTSPSAAPTMIDKLVAIRSVLEPWIVRTDADLSLLENSTSPQYSTLEWMSSDSISLDNINSLDTLLERYALAVMYFSTLVTSIPIFVDEHACDWNNGIPYDQYPFGVYCEGTGHVKFLELSDSLLTGTIPWELSLLSNLKELKFEKNKVSGPIPTELGQLTLLQVLAMSNNQLTGSLPTELGQLSSLQKLLTSNNNLASTLPTEFGQLTALEEIRIEVNDFSGTVPTELAQLPNLRSFTLTNNYLISAANDTLCSWGMTWTNLESDCLPDNEGNIEFQCSCCTLCCNSFFCE